MAVKMYNFSGIPDEQMLPFLERAKKLAKCKGDVVCKVTRGGVKVRSQACPIEDVPKWFLSTRQRTKGFKYKKGYVNTDGGYVLLQPRYRTDPLDMAEQTFWTAVHEFVHIADIQEGLRFGEYGRHWKNRPHEARAVWGTNQAKEEHGADADTEKVILDMAVAIEDKRFADLKKKGWIA